MSMPQRSKVESQAAISSTETTSTASFAERAVPVNCCLSILVTGLGESWHAREEPRGPFDCALIGSVQGSSAGGGDEFLQRRLLTGSFPDPDVTVAAQRRAVAVPAC